ncbi:MAG TPA: spore germination protein GerW family protein [Thermoanaerobaculia bacterium]|nr:spore germination protein GerW family protein [Thermoanaerobaculia bacterium]
MAAEQTLLERIAEVVQLHANAKQVYGEAIERNGTTIIPVARVQWGFGGGGLGHGAAERGGGGGGVRAQPAGFIEIKNGTAEYRPVHSANEVGLLVSAAVIGLVAGVILAKLATR